MSMKLPRCLRLLPRLRSDLRCSLQLGEVVLIADGTLERNLARRSQLAVALA